MKSRSILVLVACWWLMVSGGSAAVADERSDYIRMHYSKFEVSIPMRDGKKLFTAIYVPSTTDGTKKYPFLMMRTPYSVGPYGVDQYKTVLGPSPEFEKSGYIFVFQDVRGRYMSEGEFDNMRGHIDNKSGTQFDESSDTYDTIEWLVKNIPNNNGRVGQWGISYPGFYTAAGAIDSHPALKAVSPQAPIADWFFDDFHRNGAFVLPMGFNFFSSFGKSRPSPTPVHGGDRMSNGTKDGYQFFLDLGPLKNVNDNFFYGSISFWNDIAAHPNYDTFWQERNLLPHLQNVSANVLVVGGWFDTEDLYGPLEIYRSIERQNPQAQNHLVMGPWYHGQWNRDDGAKLGDASFGFATAQWFRDEVQFPFFESLLKDAPARKLPEATVFETGANRWRQFDSWPPAEARPITMNFAGDSRLTMASDDAAKNADGFDEYISDPAKPVPYTMEITPNWARNYVTEDQRFAAWRPDVLVYRSEVLEENFTIAGPTEVELWVSTSAGDADWVVKIIDQYPGAPITGTNPNDPNWETYPSDRQQLVRAGVIRGRFRDGFSDPKPFEPNKPTKVKLKLDDCFHTFAPGHQLMIQVQSTWFPFIDRNPQQYVPNIFEAEESDFIKATHRLYHSSEYPSQVKFLKL